MTFSILWSRRQVKCSYCEQAVIPSTKRITEIIRGKRGIFFRKHYHAPECYVLMVNRNVKKYFENNTLELFLKRSHNQGRPKLNITDEQRKLRHRALARLHYIAKRYGQTALIIHTKLVGNMALDLNEKEMLEYITMSEARDDAIMLLRENGGIPKKFEHLNPS